jgi:hypothetical protein
MKQAIRRDVDDLDGIKVLNISKFSLSRSASSTKLVRHTHLYSKFVTPFLIRFFIATHIKEIKNANEIYSENLKEHSMDLGIDGRIELIQI